MTGLILIIALIAVVTGVALLFQPTWLIKAGEWFNRVYNLDSYVYAHRVLFGGLFIVLGLVLILLI